MSNNFCYPKMGEMRLGVKNKSDFSTRSCEEGVCGACTVLAKTSDKFESVPSCCLTLNSLENAQIINGKGLEESKFGSEISDVFSKNFASQCGFCTAGMAMKMCTRKENSTPRDHLRGNLCRCTGYRN